MNGRAGTTAAYCAGVVLTLLSLLSGTDALAEELANFGEELIELPEIGETVEPATNAKLTIELELGVLRGRARAFVFVPDVETPVLSRLDWDLDNVAMAGVALAYRPRDWMQLQLKGATNRSNNADLVDYDFNIFFCPPTSSETTLCRSTHHDTQLERAFSFDGQVALRLLRYRGSELRGLLGYKWRLLAWRAYGGSANYTDAPFIGAGITYQQRWHTPYLGVRWSQTFGAFDVGLEGSGSAWASARDRDHHHFRSLVFTQSTEGADTFALGAELGYQFRPNIRLSLRYNFERWLLARGDLQVADLLEGNKQSFAGAAGTSLYTQSLNFGVSVDLDRTPDHPAAGSAQADIWRGGYVGFLAGPLLSQGRWRARAWADLPFPPFSATNTASFESTTAYAGAFIGHGLRWRGWLIGAEADFGRADADDYVAGIPGTFGAVLSPAGSDVVVAGSRWDSSARLRVGRNLGAGTLLYLTGGVAIQHLRYRVSCSFDGLGCFENDREEKFNTNRVGWAIGTGVERAFAHGWFVRAEYRYTDIGRFSHEFFSATPVDNVATRLDANSHRLLLGIGLRY